MIIVTAASHAEQVWIPRLPGVHRVRTGMGARAGKSLARFIDAHDKPSVVVSTGFCGGLSPDVPAGMIIIGDAVDFEGRQIAVDSSLVERVQSALTAANLPSRVGRIVTTESVVSSPEEKERLSRCGAIAVDMESGILSRVARGAGIQFLPLRVVLDARYSKLSFAADRLDALRAIAHPISTLRMVRTLIIAGHTVGRAIAAVAAELALRREECVA